MKRDIQQLKQNQFDLVVIGAGVHGACVARDASLRGMSVALICLLYTSPSPRDRG